MAQNCAIKQKQNKKLYTMGILNYVKNPPAMDNYLSNYGWHFSKNACDYALSLLKTKDINTGAIINYKSLDYDYILSVLKKYNITLDCTKYDLIYFFNKLKAQHSKSLSSDLMILEFIKEHCEHNQLPIFNIWYLCSLKQEQAVIWDDLL